jgi:hypothetical protein
MAVALVVIILSVLISFFAQRLSIQSIVIMGVKG